MYSLYWLHSVANSWSHGESLFTWASESLRFSPGLSTTLAIVLMESVWISVLKPMVYTLAVFSAEVPQPLG